jgi:VanZ family protein
MDNVAIGNTQPAALPAPAHSRKPKPDGGAGRFTALGHLKHTRQLFWHYWLPVLLMLSLIRFESTDLMSGAHTGQYLAELLRWVGHPLTGESLELLNMAMRKTGHVVGYGLLGFTWFLLLRGNYWLRHEYHLCLRGGIQIRRLWWRPAWAVLAVLATFAVACSDEFHQMSMPSRTGGWSDVWLDSAAATVVMVLLWLRARRRCRTTPAA